MILSKSQLCPLWKDELQSEFEKPYMSHLEKFLSKRSLQGATIFPTADNFFNSLNLTPPSLVKVVILGQDPYHGPGQAQGLSFSVSDGIRPPPSLVNIYKELASDMEFPTPKSGDLSRWAEQGVLLLNSVLSVEQGSPGSHSGKGWEKFTDAIISTLNEQRKHIVFILWGKYAWKKGDCIDSEKHHIIKSPHPSPLSAYRGFFGSKPFSEANNYLIQNGIAEIDWHLP